MSSGEDQPGRFAGFGGFGSFKNMGETMRKQAEELAKTAASQVSDINAKLVTTPVSKPSSNGAAIDSLMTPTTSATSTTAATPAASMKSPENVSKEELLDVLQKMNKKVKALTSLRTQLADRVKSAEEDKERLIKLMTDEILGGEVALQEGEDPVEQLQKAWHKVDERNSLALQGLQAEYQTVAMQCKEEVDQVKRAAEAGVQAEVEKIRADVAAETLANGNEAWEVMREQLTKRHQEEAQLLRKELHEQYDYQLAQKEEEFNQRLAESISMARAEMEERNEAETSENRAIGSNEEIEALKEQHVKEMTKLKEAAAAQLLGLKKKVAAFRTAEIEKIKKETIEKKDAETAAKLDELRKGYEEKMETIRKDLSSVHAGPPTEEELERLKDELQTSHLEELESVKQRIALSLEETHEDTMERLRLQRENELRSVKAEIQALSHAQIQQVRIDLENEYNSKLDLLRQQHIEEVERISSSSTTQTSDMQNENMSLKGRLEEMESILESWKAQIETNKAEYEQNLAEIKKSITSQVDTELRTQLQAEFEEKLQSCLLQAAAEARLSLDEATARYKDEIASLQQSAKEEKEQLERQLIIESDVNRENIQAAADAKLFDAVTRAELKASKMSEQAKATFEEEHEAKLALLKQETDEALLKAIQEAELMADKKLQVLCAEHSSKLEEMKMKEEALREELRSVAEMEASVDKAAEKQKREIEALQLRSAEEIEQHRTSLVNAHNEAIESLKAEAAINLEKSLILVQREAAQSADQLKAAMETEKQAAVNNVMRESEVTLSNAISEVEARAAEQLESLRIAMSKQVEDMQSHEKEISEELRSSKILEESLSSQLEDLNARMAAAEDDRKALAEAAQSGESSSKMLEERLTAQRASFDKTMTALKEQFASEKQLLLTHEQDLINGKDVLESELGDLRQQVVQLEAVLQSARETLNDIANKSKLENDEHKAQLASLAESHAANVSKLKNDILKIQNDHAAELDRALVGGREREAQFQALVDDANIEMQYVKERHESEQMSLQETHESRLNEALKEIDERESRVQDLSFQMDNWNETQSRLSLELEKARNDFAQLESGTLDLRKTIDDGAITIETLKTQFESERAALQQDYEEQLNRAKALADQREESLKDLIAKAASGDESYASASAELETARNRLAEFVVESRDVQQSLELQLATLKLEKDSAVEELAQVLSREEVHKGMTADIMQQLETARQQLSEREKELQGNLDLHVAESHATAEKLSEEAGQLKGIIEAMKAEHAAILNDKEQSLSRALDDRATHVADTVKSVEMEMQAALKALSDDYDAKLADARDKQTKAVELVKKLKAATTAKLQGIEKERICEKSSFEEQISNLEVKLKSDHDARISSLHEEHAALETDWEGRLIEKEKEREDALSLAKIEWETLLRQTAEEQTAKVSILQGSLEEANRQLQQAKSAAPKEIERLVEAKTEAIREHYEEQLKSMADSHASELESARSTAQQKFHQLKLDLDQTVTRLEADKARTLEESKLLLETSLRELSSKHDAEMEGMQEKLAKHVDDVKQHFLEKTKSTGRKHGEEIQSFTERLALKDEHLAKITVQMNKVRNDFAALEKQHDGLQTKFSSDVVVKQALQKKIEELQKQLAESIANGQAATQSLFKEQEILEKRVANLDDELLNTVHERDASKNKIEELQGKLEALGANLNLTLDEKNALESELQSTAKKAAKLDLAEIELNSLRDQLNKLKLEQAKSNSLLEKLQEEKEANTRNHGQRTALVGMLEEQLADLNEKNSELNAKLQATIYDLSARDEDIQHLQEALESTQKGMADVQNARKQASESLTTAQKGADAKKAKMIEALQREVHSLQQQMAKKSAAAQKLIQQREAECIELRKTTKALQQEVDKGSLSDRRIFELAAQQSNRESVAVSEIEVRDQMVDKLTEKLEVQDVDLAEAEYNVKHYENQVEELCRIRRREDVNLDYLKSIVVQYLSKPPGSTEREALLPVLATLLQFDSNDYKVIEDGKNKLNWWGSVTPILINPPTPKPPRPEQAAPLLSAEISVSRTTHVDAPLNNGRSRTTSLEF